MITHSYPPKIGRYEIIKELGRGGMAIVYQAYDPHFERQVALKVLPSQFLHDANFRTRFEREAKAIASLEHPAVVPVHDFGEDAGWLYLVMRLMLGGSLTERLRQGRLTLQETLAILQRIGLALDAAHQRGIIHRDLKPDNVLFDQYGTAYLSDFGIVRLMESGATLTGTKALGTPGYMSPEQIRGQQLDGRSDVYALGILLFEMLAGQRPFMAETPAMVLVKQMTSPAPHLYEVGSDLSEQYDTVIQQAMAPLPEMRPSNASHVARLLEEAMIATATSLTPPYASSGAAFVNPTALGSLPDMVLPGRIPRDIATPGKPGSLTPESSALDGGKGTPVYSPYPDDLTMVESASDSWSLAAQAAAAPMGKSEVPSQRRRGLLWAGLAGLLLIAGGAYWAWGAAGSEETAVAPTAEVLTPAEEAAPVVEPAEETAVGDEHSGQDHANAAQAALDAGDLEMALAEADGAISHDDADPTFYELRAYIYEQMGDYWNANNDWQRAIDLAPDNAYYHLRMGVLQNEIGEYETAVNNLTKAIELDPEYVDAYANRCSAYDKLGDYDSAYADCSICIEKEPENETCFVRRGAVLKQQDKLADALIDWQRALEINPENAYTLHDIAQTYLWNLNDPETALAYTNDAIAITSDDPYFFLTRAYAYRYQDNTEAAINDYQTFLDTVNHEDCSDCVAEAQRYLQDYLPPQPDRLTNFAIGRSASASSVHSDQTPDLVTNGNPDWGWVSAEPAPQWIEIDLGEPRTITAIDLRTDQDNGGNPIHHVWVSGPGTNDEAILLHTFTDYTEWGYWLHYDLEEPMEGIQYMRVETEETPASYAGWFEIRVLGYGTDN